MLESPLALGDVRGVSQGGYNLGFILSSQCLAPTLCPWLPGDLPRTAAQTARVSCLRPIPCRSSPGSRSESQFSVDSGRPLCSSPLHLLWNSPRTRIPRELGHRERGQCLRHRVFQGQSKPSVLTSRFNQQGRARQCPPLPSLPRQMPLRTAVKVMRGPSKRLGCSAGPHPWRLFHKLPALHRSGALPG